MLGTRYSGYNCLNVPQPKSLRFRAPFQIWAKEIYHYKKQTDTGCHRQRFNQHGLIFVLKSVIAYILHEE